MPVRIYDIAKKLGIESKEVLAKARALGITAAKVPSSSLDKITAEYLENELGGVRPAPPPPTPPEPVTLLVPPTVPPVPAAPSPVEAMPAPAPILAPTVPTMPPVIPPSAPVVEVITLPPTLPLVAEPVDTEPVAAVPVVQAEASLVSPAPLPVEEKVIPLPEPE